MQSIRNHLLATAASVAENINVAVRPRPIVSNKASKRGKPGRRIIAYDRVGPSQRQVGIKWLHGECWPIMQTYCKHMFLHATKGWRRYSGGAAPWLPRPVQAEHPLATFYGNQLGRARA
jgi:hypothetical protein